MAAGRSATCEVIIAEVLRGAATETARAELTQGMGSLVCLSMEGTGAIAGRLALELRSQNITIPTTDLLIAATAALHDAALLHLGQRLSQAADVLGLDEFEV